MAIVVNDDNTITITGAEAASVINELSQSVQTTEVTQAVSDTTLEQVVTTESAATSQVTVDGVEIVIQTVSDSIIKEMYLVDHGILDGLADDDHPQYLNAARGDVRYTPISHISSGNNPHGLDAVNLPGLSAWGLRVTPADLDFINTYMNDDAIESTKIASIVAGKIASGTMAARIVLGDVFVASKSGSVLNDDQTSLGVLDERVEMGFIDDFDTQGNPVKYFLRHRNGYAGNHPSYKSNFSIDDQGNVIIEGNVTITGGLGIGNLSDAGALATRDTNTFYSPESPVDPIEGDIWYDTDNGNEPNRFNGVIWVSVRDADIAIAIGAADSKIETYVTDTEPTLNGLGAVLSGADNGDLWIDTGNGNVLNYYQHPNWVNAQDSSIASVIQSAATAQATADGKVTTYVGAEPLSVSIGDLWFDAGNKLLKRSTTEPTPTWEVVANSFDESGLLTDTAGWSTTAEWDSVSDPSGTKPADNADVTDVGGTNYVVRGLAAPNQTVGGNVTAVVAGIGDWGFVLGDASGLSQMMVFDLIPLEANTNYVVSFMASTTIAGSDVLVELFPDALPETTIVVDSTTPKLYSFVFNSADANNMALADLRFIKSSGGVNPTAPITIYDVKFEKGTQYTDWSPYVPIDDKADTTVNALEQTTTITGGGIELSGGGKLNSITKASYADTDAGVYFGWDNTQGDYVFNVGDAANYIKWDGSQLHIAGSLAIQAPIDYENVVGATKPGYLDEPTHSSSMCALSKKVVMGIGIHHYGVYEDNTTLYVNGVVRLVNLAAGTVGTFTDLQIGDQVAADKPFSLINDAGWAEPTYLQAGQNFIIGGRQDVSENLLVSIYPTQQDATVTITKIGGASVDILEWTTNTEVVTKETVTTVTINRSTETNYSFVVTSDQPILVFTVNGNSADKITYFPASREIVSAKQISAWDVVTGLSVPAVDSVYYQSNNILSGVIWGDGAGSDGESGIPLTSLGDTYLIPHDIRDYTLVAVEPTVITIYNNTGAVYQTHDLSTASKEVPGVVQVGLPSGAATEPVILATSSLFSGTGRFLLRTNVSEDEYVASGYNSKYRHEYTSAGITPEEVANSAVGMGSNLLFNSLVNPFNNGWADGSNTSLIGQYSLYNRNDGIWNIPGTPALEIYQGNEAGLETEYIWNIMTTSIPVNPGGRYQLSGLTGAHRCAVQLAVQWRDKDAVHLSTTTTPLNDAEYSGGPSKSGWGLLHIFDNAPATAATATVYVRKYATKTGLTTSHGFYTELMFCEAAEAQTIPTPWNPGGENYYRGATVGANWGTNISGQPTDAQLLNDQQLWNEVSGTGKPVDYSMPSDGNLLYDPNFARQIAGDGFWTTADAAVVFSATSGKGGTPGCQINADSSINDVSTAVLYPSQQNTRFYYRVEYYVSSTFNGTTTLLTTTYNNNQTSLLSWPSATLSTTVKGSFVTQEGYIEVTHAQASYTKFTLSVRETATAGYVIFSNVEISRSAPDADITESALTVGTTITGGGIVMSAGGSIVGGQSGYDSGNGFFIGYDVNQYKMSIGNSAGNKLTWDGDVLSVTGSINGSNITGGLLQTSSNTVSERITINEGGNNHITVYGDRGDGTVDTVATLGVTTQGTDNVVGHFGGSAPGYNNTGVLGESNSGFGVYGFSISSAGGVFYSQTHYAVKANGANGLTCSNTDVCINAYSSNTTSPAVQVSSSLGTGMSVYGKLGGISVNSDSVGVFSASINDEGVWGYTTGNSQAGVKGEHRTGSNGVGVRGLASLLGTSGTGGKGVWGTAEVSDGFGVYGDCSTGVGVQGETTSGIGIAGKSTSVSGGIAGKFEIATATAGSHLLLVPTLSTSVPNHVAPAGSIVVNASGLRYINKAGTTTWTAF